MLNCPLAYDFWSYTYYKHVTRAHTQTLSEEHKAFRSLQGRRHLRRQRPTPNWASSQRDLHCFDRGGIRGRLSKAEVVSHCSPAPRLLAACQTATLGKWRRLVRPLAASQGFSERISAVWNHGVYVLHSPRRAVCEFVFVYVIYVFKWIYVLVVGA